MANADGVHGARRLYAQDSSETVLDGLCKIQELATQLVEFVS